MSDTQIPSLTPLTEDQVLQLEVEGGSMWFIKNTSDGSEKTGPFTEENLRDYVLSHQNFSADFVANKLGTEEWTTIVELSEFKRKPQLVSMAAINTTTTFFLLENGNKIGPFKEEEIIQKLKNKEIIYSDFISIDKGFNWLKVFELPQFDSRSPSLVDSLPLSPTEEIFKISKLQGLKNIQDNQVTKDILAFVALASRRKIEALPDAPEEEISHWWQAHRKAIFATMSLAVIASFSWKYFTSSSSNLANTEAEQLESVIASQNPGHSMNMPTNKSNGHPAVRRSPANDGMPSLQMNHHNSQANNVPVPIEDAQINYDEPIPADAPEPAEPPPAAETVASPANEDQPQAVAEAEPMPEPEIEREPANAPDPISAQAPPQPKEEEIFNQEATN